MTRSTRRGASGNANPAVTVARSPSHSPDSAKKSIRLTVKMPSSKLREATSGGKQNVAINSRERFEGGEIITGPRNSRAKRVIVDESESEEDEDEDADEEAEASPGPNLSNNKPYGAHPITQAGDEDDEEDAEGEEDDEQEEELEDDEVDAEGESVDDDAEEDTYMEDSLHAPAPTMRMPALSKPSLIVTPTPDEAPSNGRKPNRSTIEDDVSEELSELDSDAGANDNTRRGALEGDDDDVDMDQDDDDVDSDGTPRASESRGSTPDISKMTKRQQSRLNQVEDGNFLQLPMGKFRFFLPSPCAAAS